MVDIASILISAAVAVLAIVLHESAHALAAYALGDRTARDRGRVSLNPLHHIDPFGTIILPLLLVLAGGPVFAFAKPVPVYVGNLKHPKRDEVLVSLAGPLSNIALAVLAALLMRSLGLEFLFSGGAGADLALDFLVDFMSVNLSLAFFNLLPLPPLDGSSIILPFLRGRALEMYYQVQRYAMPVLLIVLYLLPMVLHIDLIAMYFQVTAAPLFQLLVNIALGF